ncbi:alpha/beta fold hydrolase [Bacillus sp. KH172YL63]|uniref:alpha/beta fold hydrolase n=1 Tax=Bacillus sp. KH172YL63 TaxID=2709784 RepID=UPI0013E51FFA|nr:alpha/beta fold hydrolase [Bacillus sp. KH172YL63]BCB05121.1 hypothetical protein KH172YL63_32540 [Bacillus sp. KH172YL63]
MKQHAIKMDNHTFFVYETGDRQLPTLICLHGMTAEANSFLELAGYLRNDFHILLVDLPGHGTTAPLDREEDYHFSSLAKRIMAVISR